MNERVKESVGYVQLSISGLAQHSVTPSSRTLSLVLWESGIQTGNTPHPLKNNVPHRHARPPTDQLGHGQLL